MVWFGFCWFGLVLLFVWCGLIGGFVWGLCFRFALDGGGCGIIFWYVFYVWVVFIGLGLDVLVCGLFGCLFGVVGCELCFGICLPLLLVLIDGLVMGCC